ncbi:hypothetical protein [Brevibacillus sp. IT-7CA2]
MLQHFVALFCNVTRRVRHGEERIEDFYPVRVPIRSLALIMQVNSVA